MGPVLWVTALPGCVHHCCTKNKAADERNPTAVGNYIYAKLTSISSKSDGLILYTSHGQNEVRSLLTLACCNEYVGKFPIPGFPMFSTCTTVSVLNVLIAINIFSTSTSCDGVRS